MIGEWESMEADSGNPYISVDTSEWAMMVKSIGYYHMRAAGYSDMASRVYWPFAYLKNEMFDQRYMIFGRVYPNAS